MHWTTKQLRSLRRSTHSHSHWTGQQHSHTNQNPPRNLDNIVKTLEQRQSKSSKKQISNKLCYLFNMHYVVQLDEITAVLRTRRLRWYGHAQRATSCINSITRLGLPGTRDRGRPRKTWSACVRNDMTICNLDGVNPLDRNSWRMSVRCCQVLPTSESGTTAAP